MWIKKLDLIPKLCREVGLGRAHFLWMYGEEKEKQHKQNNKNFRVVAEVVQ